MRSGEGEIVRSALNPLPSLPEQIALQPYTLTSFEAKLTELLKSDKWQLAFGDPYPIGAGDELEQHVTLSITQDADRAWKSIAVPLISLSERLIQVPITLHRVQCAIAKGEITDCELQLTIRGLRT